MEGLMTSSKKSVKKIRIASSIVAIVCIFFSAVLFAQGGVRQFQRQISIGGRLPAVILLIGYSKDSADIEKLFDIVSSKTNDFYARLSWQNPSGDVGKLNASAALGPVKVSEDTIAAFETADKISKWSDGAFDIAFAGDGNYRDIKIDKGASTVELKKTGMHIRFDQMMSGLMAEYISRLIYASGMQNAMVKVASAFRGIGQNAMGPWKVEIEDSEGTFARHALNLTVANTGVASVSASQYRSAKLIDPRSKKEESAPCRGVVVLMNDAALADGIANAVFILGPDDGMKLLTKVAKGLIVDANGKFLRSPGF